MIIVHQQLGREPGPRSGFDENTDYILLVEDGWDDDGYQTLFEAELRLTTGQRIALGPVKIIEKGMGKGRPKLEQRVSTLPDSFASLGQDPEYYEKLKLLRPRVRNEYLTVMRDAAFKQSVFQSVSKDPAWVRSVVRFSQAESALDLGRRILHNKQRKQQGVLSFELHRSDAIGASTLPARFEFSDNETIPGRINVLIGYNGSGKTRLLADLAVAASKVDQVQPSLFASELRGSDTNFGSVVAVSYSAFDDFARPMRPTTTRVTSARTDFFGYVYCGLRAPESATSRESNRKNRLKSFDDLTAEFELAVEQSQDREDGTANLHEAMRLLAREPSFALIGVDLKELVSTRGNTRTATFRRLSTGHKIVIHIITQLVANLRQRSLVLLDEPETHLHPPLIAALLRSIDFLLNQFDSFAIIATHSPVIVQEIPSQYVQVVSRTVESSRLEDTEIETFAENVGTITRSVFSLDNSMSDFQGILKRLAQEMSLEDADRLFPRGMGSTARALFLNYAARSEDASS